MSNELGVQSSSGNVYADLGFDNPEVELVKADLAIEIILIISAPGWSETEAATAHGIDEATLSNLLFGRLGDVSPERLMQFMSDLFNSSTPSQSRRDFVGLAPGFNLASPASHLPDQEIP